MPTDFVTLSYLGTYAGAVAATYLIVSYLKGLVKAVLPDYFVRILALIVAAAILGFVLLATGKTDPGSIGTAVINAFLVAFAAMGVHQATNDPAATGSSKGNTVSSGGTPGGFVPRA